MLGRVGRALVVHELLERTRDRWVLVVSVLFALLASAVSLYGNDTGGEAGEAGATAAALVGPSLVTLASLLVPLVALVLSHDAIVGERDRNTLGLLLSLPVGRGEVVLAKFLGRGIALVVAVGAGIGTAALVASAGQGAILLTLVGPTILLGLAFLSIGLLLSSIVDRPTTAASLVVVTWFLLVFFYDLALLALLVVTDGGVSAELIASLVQANPAGLYRLQMMEALSGPQTLESLGMVAASPGKLELGLRWAGWILGPVALSGVLLARRKVVR